jgi:hypothetical protein
MVTVVAPALKNRAPHASEKSFITSQYSEQLGSTLVSRKEEDSFQRLPQRQFTLLLNTFVN